MNISDFTEKLQTLANDINQLLIRNERLTEHNNELMQENNALKVELQGTVSHVNLLLENIEDLKDLADNPYQSYAELLAANRLMKAELATIKQTEPVEIYHTFSEMLEHLKKGGKARRAKWDGVYSFSFCIDSGALSLYKEGSVCRTTAVLHVDDYDATDWILLP